MIHMIMTLGALMLSSMYLVAVVQYVDPAPVIAQDIANRTEKGFNQLKDGYDMYLVAHGGVPPNSMNDITPTYAFLPPSPDTVLAWSFGVSGNGRYFCYSGQMNGVEIEAMKRLQKRFSPQAFFVNTFCGATTNAVPTTNGNQTQMTAATYWMALP